MQHTAALPKRLSCDRCYAQKLRCPRSSTSDDPSCIRCLRQKVQCVYSTALPKGRPRAAARASAAGGATTTTTATATTAPSISDTAPPIFSAEDLASFTSWLPDPTWGDPLGFFPPPVVPQPPPLDTTPPPRASSASVLENPEQCVGRLSALATRLHAVYRTTRALSDHPLITNAAFEAVATLFNVPSSSSSSPPSTTTAATNLRETFTSSHHLLEIISHLLGTTPTTDSSPALVADETVIYHFTIACYSLLLLIYATLLTALHRDALTHAQPSLSTTTTTTNTPTGRDNTSTWCSTRSLVELRLFLLFHLITYFLDRLQQSVRMYTAQFEKQTIHSTTTTAGKRPPPPTRRRWSDEAAEEVMMVEEPWEQHIAPPPPPVFPSSSLGSISELETRARSALMQLRLSLGAARGGLVDV
ncbi:Zn(II)2Cys6 transcription factor domain-containing protein [Aspergillus clavatus NRRL 1]|uniref:C6 zinc finger domain protein n=1 Tax=Aspergillus clavatus (strain ATCC 1007 / CBS 513.65 / DSM 816 / NCTC 3887 / NRRL 1 / QM 1276 / 107) TaxID=344612 RepID=A1CLP2_ASPCL|nr:C6 zinc finger domain protein [Aspergillus clavatus NRRL 1]EAW09021.1 C6 zinc finger domain protein [Aspergillus clavatus NRRL 1]